MIVIPSVKGKAVAVMGLGTSGLATARALLESGARVLAWDDDQAGRDKAEADGVPLTELARADWTRIESLVLSPGIPHTFPAAHPIADLARDAGCEIICDVELLGRSRPDATFVGVTGTNGKSTTTALIGHILEQAGRDMEAGGNLGPPVLGMRPLGEAGIYVLEMSSYQLERTFSIVFDVAVLLNIAPDHLDRHGGMDGYIGAKMRIFDRQGAKHTAIIGVDDDFSRTIDVRLLNRSQQHIIEITKGEPPEGAIGVKDGALVDNTDGQNRHILDLAEVPALPGAHNWQNAAAAFAACKAVGVPAKKIAAGVRDFPGLPHRQELATVIDGVPYVNDSKATNPNATANALASYPAVYWIAGGLAKDGGFNELTPYLDRILHAFLIGEAAQPLARFLGNRVAHTVCGDLAEAVAQAHRMAAADDGDRRSVVLLSPACASFDQFANFAARGDAYRDLVMALPGGREGAPAAPSRGGIP